MPLLEKIIVSDFRNIGLAELSFAPGVNCICGDNGQGKTNLLDAIHFLSMTKSAFGIPDAFCIRSGRDSYSISGRYLMEDGLSSRVSISFSSSSGKTLRRDDKLCDRISAHIGLFPVVTVSPQDSALVSDGGDGRRRFVNAVLSQMSPGYLSAVQNYNRLLSQRNRVLKDFRPDMQLIGVLDKQMNVHSDTITRVRKDFAEQLGASVARHYARLCNSGETVSVSYRSDILDSDGVVGSLEDLLAGSKEKDMYLKYTSVGVQRDDFLFEMDGSPIRRCGSQGQQKSFLIALKLAQYDIMKTACGFAPMLLLDDVFDKLDGGRIGNLLDVVQSDGYGQIFITETNRSRLEKVLGELSPQAAWFNAVGGEF